MGPKQPRRKPRWRFVLTSETTQPTGHCLRHHWHYRAGIEAAIESGNQGHPPHPPNHWTQQLSVLSTSQYCLRSASGHSAQTVVKPATEVKSNDPPVAKPEPKKEERVAVAPNSFSLNGSSISAADARNTQEDAQDHIDETVDDIRDDMTDKLEDDAEALEASARKHNEKSRSG